MIYETTVIIIQRVFCKVNLNNIISLLLLYHLYTISMKSMCKMRHMKGYYI